MAEQLFGLLTIRSRTRCGRRSVSSMKGILQVDRQTA
jgi:hypothetical protein